ncbi:hypothetical protein KGP36_06865 [Patescibacteria group bacterium]|nr:hypothetical protein [Patescibacteria group bacterium]
MDTKTPILDAIRKMIQTAIELTGEPPDHIVLSRESWFDLAREIDACHSGEYIADKQYVPPCSVIRIDGVPVTFIRWRNKHEGDEKG